MSDKEFLKESLLVKLRDDDPSVVLTVLELNKVQYLICINHQKPFFLPNYVVMN